MLGQSSFFGREIPEVPIFGRKLAASKGLVFGCAAATYEFRNNDFAPALLRDAAQIVPEY